MPRVIWKGAITFGLVHIPVVLHAASTRTGLSFDLVDKRTADPIGYKKINKTTGKEVDKDDIVRAFEYEKGHYVMLADEEIKKANVASTQTVEILGFVGRHEIPFEYLETPYYLSPDRRGDKVYALLREALVRTKKIGVASVVLHTKQHLAALVPVGKVLVLNTLRWADEVLDVGALGAPATAKAAGLAEAEIAMAIRLVDEMSTTWEPTKYHDSFREDVEALVARKVAAGKTHVIDDGGASPARRLPSTTSTRDLTELLKSSLRKLPSPSVDGSPIAKKPATRKAARKRPAAKKPDAKKPDAKRTAPRKRVRASA